MPDHTLPPKLVEAIEAAYNEWLETPELKDTFKDFLLRRIAPAFSEAVREAGECHPAACRDEMRWREAMAEAVQAAEEAGAKIVVDAMANAENSTFQDIGTWLQRNAVGKGRGALARHDTALREQFAAECQRFHEEGHKCATCGREDLAEAEVGRYFIKLIALAAKGEPDGR
jgi:hypothetical protein